MRVSAIMAGYHNHSYNMNRNNNHAVNFQGNFAGSLLPAGAAIAVMMGVACSNGTKEENEDERNRFPYPGRNDDNPFPNDDWPDTAY